MTQTPICHRFEPKCSIFSMFTTCFFEPFHCCKTEKIPDLSKTNSLMNIIKNIVLQDRVPDFFCEFSRFILSRHKHCSFCLMPEDAEFTQWNCMASTACKNEQTLRYFQSVSNITRMPPFLTCWNSTWGCL